MSLIQTFPDGGGGGTNIPNGSTVTPTDDISIWLKCAELTETYTTLNEVLADDDIMEKLFRSENASDYLVRSTTWASDITANQTAMILIGANDYCADKLLEDSTWSAAICASNYWNEVLKGLVPVMTSNATPYGEASASSEAAVGYEAWNAFDGDSNTRWSANAVPNGWIQYKFTKSVIVHKFKMQNHPSNVNCIPTIFSIYGSNDGTNYTKIGDYTNSNMTAGGVSVYNINNTTPYLYYKFDGTCNQVLTIAEAQFYGRASKTTIYSAANDIVSFVDDEGAKVVTTDATGKGEVTIVCKPNTDITFTSSVAKDPDNLSENYSKVVTVKSSAKPVYVMPNKDVLYWYGYKGSEYEVCSTANGWTAYQFNTPTENTNYLDCYGANTGGGSGIYFSGIGYKSAKTVGLLKVICQGTVSVNNTETAVYGNPSKDITALTHSKLFGNTTLSLQSENTSGWGSSYIAIGAVNNRRTNIYAVWYENGDDGNYDKADADLIAPVQKTLTAKKAYAVGEQFVYNQTLYRVAQSIAQGAQITIGTNSVLASSITDQIKALWDAINS